MASEAPPLPPGWTEHKAPTGHTYYFNKALNKSTYTRPAPSPAPQPQTQQEAFIPSYSAGQFAGGYKASQFQAPPGQQHQWSHDSRKDGRRQPLRPDGDRPKHKFSIPGCAPWVLVKTKYGRRFVHNTDTNESFWKFPDHVMKGVIEFDRREREKQQRRDKGEASEDEDEKMDHEQGSEVKVVPVKQEVEEGEEEESEYESEYEEVTDDGEDEEESQQEPMDEGPREMTEEDMLWQLQQMQQDGEGGDHGEDEYYEEEPPLSDEDAKALFRDLLDDAKISPFTPWDRIVEEGTLVDDERYLALTSMKARRECFDDWSRDKIAAIKEQREKQAKQDPKVPYFALLDEHASTKLYWPEFKRKFRKEAAMKDMKLSEKDKEKYYREHVKRLAMPKDALKKDLTALLKSLPLASLNRDTNLDSLPSQLLTDLRFISLPAKTRKSMIEAYISTLPPAPANDRVTGANAAAEADKKRERERRERALRDRQDKVEEAKLRQSRDLKYGRQRLEEKERELERAMRINKDGLRRHFADNGTREDAEMQDAN